MKKFYSILFVTILLAFFSVCFAQENDTELVKKIDYLNQKAKSSINKPDSLIIYSKQAFDLSEEINYENGQANALKFMGIYAHLKSDFDDAINYYNRSLKLFNQLDNELEIGKLNLNLATTYNAKLDYVNGTTYALKSLNSFKKVNDLNGEARVLNLLGIVSHVQKNYKEALNYFKQYNNLATKVKDTKEIGSSFNNIGSTYERLDQLDSAIYFYKKALIYKSKNGSKSDVGSVYQNIGGLYQKKEDGKKALSYHLLSKHAYSAEGNKKMLSQSYFNIGLAYKLLKDTVNAKKWFNSAIILAKKINEKEILAESYEKLAELNISKNSSESDYKTAFENLQSSINHKDSILDINKIEVIEELKTQYETEKKEQKIKDLSFETKIKDLEISRKNNLLFFALAVILLIAISVWLYLNRRKIKNKIILQKAIIEQQDIATKAVLDAEERERRRIATDLHDGVGQMLSATLMNLNGFASNVKNIPTEDQLNLEKSLALLNESYDEMRSISHQMMPNALLKAGLTTAVREFLAKIDENQLKINLDISGFNSKLPDNIETVLYRVIQESVNNVIKHAKANKLSIQLHKDEDGVSVSIEDNGIGFDPKIMKSGIGLSNIKSRISFLNGTIDYDSAPGKGTFINIFIPINDNAPLKG